MKLRILILSTLVFLSPASLFAETAEEVAKDYFNHLNKGKYAEACDLFAPSAVKQFRDMMNFVAEGDDADGIVSQFFGAGTKAEDVKKMNDKDFFAGFMGSLFQMMGEVNFTGIKIIGSVPEGDIHHVVTRMTVKVEDISMEALEVISLKKLGEGKWGVMLKGDISALAQQLRKNLEPEEATAE